MIHVCQIEALNYVYIVYTYQDTHYLTNVLYDDMLHMCTNDCVSLNHICDRFVYLQSVFMDACKKIHHPDTRNVILINC